MTLGLQRSLSSTGVDEKKGFVRLDPRKGKISSWILKHLRSSTVLDEMMQV